jgi:hypothetical protein
VFLTCSQTVQEKKIRIVGPWYPWVCGSNETKVEEDPCMLGMHGIQGSEMTGIY